MAENAATGEQTIQLGTTTYVFRPTFRAINEIETRAGFGLRIVGEKIVRESHMGLLALCLWAFNTNGGKKTARNLDHFGDLIVEHGHLKLLVPVSNIITGTCLRGASTLEDDMSPEDAEDAEEGDDAQVKTKSEDA